MKRVPVPGWRIVECHECHRSWKIPTRDCSSPSHETCPECYEELPILESIPDPTLQTHMGNLVNQPNPIQL